MSDVFISYSRKDKAFVQRLNDALAARQQDVWVDWDDIPPTADWRAQITSGIEGANAFVFVLSPDSLASVECGYELDKALEHAKRIIPVLHREPDGRPVPEALASRNWIFLRGDEDFDAGVETLAEALGTDLEWAAAHTRLVVRAREWEQAGRDSGFLLHGADLTQAESWLASETPGREPETTPLQREYVAASREAATRRQRRLLAGVSVALVVSVALAVFALIELGIARDQTSRARSVGLASVAGPTVGSDPELSALLALEGVRIKDTPEAEQVLRRALGAIQVRAVVRHRAAVNAASLSPDGSLLATASDDGTARISNARTGRTVAVLRGHHGVVRFAAFSPGGRIVATAAHDGTARLWDARSGRSLAVLGGGSGATEVAFGGSGRLVATGGDDGAARVWSAPGGRLLATVRPRAGAVVSVALSADDRRLVTLQDDGSARIWRVTGGRPVAVLRAPGGAALDSVAVSPAGGLVAAGADDGATRLWTLDGRRAGTLRAPSNDVPALAFSRDGRFLASADLNRENTARVWDVRERRLVSVLRGHGAPINSVAFDADARRVLTASDDATARIWQRDGQQIMVLGGHRGSVFSAQFSADGNAVATASADRTARVWESTPGRTLAEIAQPGVAGVDVSADERRAIVAGGDGRATVLDAVRGRIVARIALTSRHGAAVTGVALSPDGRRAALATTTGTALVDAAGGGGAPVRLATGALGAGYSLAFTPDGRRVLTASENGTAAVWDAASGRRLASMRVSRAHLLTIRPSPDGRTLAVSDGAGGVSVWSARTGRRLLVLRGHRAPVGDVAFDPAGRRLVTAADDDTSRVFSLATGRALLVLHNADRVSSAEFSHDGRSIVTGGADGLGRVWDARTGRGGAVLRGHTGGIFEAHFSPDDRVVVTGSNDGTARVWDARTGQVLEVLAGHTGPTGALFAGGGGTIVTGSVDGTLRLYACDACGSLSRLEATARVLLPRGLTPSERARYLSSL